MNERIDELMIQAGTRFEFLHGVHYEDFQYRKFAELIVKECSDLFETEWGEEKLTGNDVGYVLKKHFGVEE